jgi:hypothetical protein
MTQQMITPIAKFADSKTERFILGTIFLGISILTVRNLYLSIKVNKIKLEEHEAATKGVVK